MRADLRLRAGQLVAGLLFALLALGQYSDGAGWTRVVAATAVAVFLASAFAAVLPAPWAGRFDAAAPVVLGPLFLLMGVGMIFDVLTRDRGWWWLLLSVPLLACGVAGVVETVRSVARRRVAAVADEV